MSVKALGSYPAGSTDIASKQYVDDAQQGEGFKLPCYAATAAALPFGPAVYASVGTGVNVGVGDTLTAASNGVLTVDGWAVYAATNLAITNVTFSSTTITATVSSTANMGAGQPIQVTGITGFTTNNPNGNFTVASVASSTTFTYTANLAPTGTYASGGNVASGAARILVKNESNTSHHGIYTVTTVGTASAKYVLTRATDMDSATVINTGVEKYDGALTHVSGGNTQAGTGWVLNATYGITPGTTGFSFTQVHGPGMVLTVPTVAKPIIGPDLISYTPTLGGTSAALGNGTMTAGYVQYGKLTYFEIEIVRGTTTNFSSTGLTLTLPLTNAGRAAFHGMVLRPAAADVMIWGSNPTTGLNLIHIEYISGSASAAANLTNTAPVTWSTSDILVISGWFLATT